MTKMNETEKIMTKLSLSKEFRKQLCKAQNINILLKWKSEMEIAIDSEDISSLKTFEDWHKLQLLKEIT